MNKVIAMNARVKNIQGTNVDMFVECKGLLAVIYHHAKLYDDCMVARDDYESRIHYQAMKICGRIFDSTVAENFSLKDKLALLGEAQAICLRMMQEAKDERIRTASRSLNAIYSHSINHHIMMYMNEKNGPSNN